MVGTHSLFVSVAPPQKTNINLAPIPSHLGIGSAARGNPLSDFMMQYPLSVLTSLSQTWVRPLNVLGEGDSALGMLQAALVGMRLCQNLSQIPWIQVGLIEASGTHRKILFRCGECLV